MQLPQGLTELQLDFVIVSMNQQIQQKFQRKIKSFNLLSMDVQELMSQLQTKCDTKSRCAIFVRPLSVTQMPDQYKRALQVLQELRFPHVELAENIFENILVQCERDSLTQTAYASNLQGLPQEQVAQLSLTSGYANCSSFTAGFGNCIQSIKNQTQQPSQTNAHIQTMILVLHDFKNNYQTYLSDQMRCERAIGLQLVVPVTMYKPGIHADSYSPVQMLPPLCDDPTNPHFYVNDCRPVVCYSQQIQQVPIPRLHIRGAALLNSNEFIVSKNEDSIKIASDAASLYYQQEQVIGIAVNSMAKLIYDQMMHTMAIYKDIVEQVQLIKNGMIKSLNFVPGDFFSNSGLVKIHPEICSIQQFTFQMQENHIKFKDVPRTCEIFVNDLVKYLRVCFNLVIGQITSHSDKQYLQAIAGSMNKQVITTIVSNYVFFIIKNSTEAVLDYDDVEQQLTASIADVLVNKIVAGYFVTGQQPDAVFYKTLRLSLSQQKMFDLLVEPVLQGADQPDQAEQNGRLSRQTLEILSSILLDQITVRSQSVYYVQRPQRRYNVYQTAQLLQQQIYIAKILKQKQTVPKPSTDFSGYYVVREQKQEPKPTSPEISDSENQNSKSIRDRYKNVRLQEDTGQGKCSVCPLVYNNYKEHCRSQVHRGRYLEALKQEGIFNQLGDLAKRTELKNQIISVFAQLCIYVEAKYFTSYEKAAKAVNFVLRQVTNRNIRIDENDEPRSNSPSCRSQQFRAWREAIVGQKMKQFEESSAKNVNTFEATTISFAVRQADELRNDQIFHSVVEKLVQDVETRFGNLDQYFNKVNENPKEILTLNDIQDDPPFTGVHDVVDEEILYDKLKEVISKIEVKQDDSPLQLVEAQGLAGLTPEQYIVLQEELKNIMNIKYSSSFEISYADTFDAFIESQKQYQPMVQSTVAGEISQSIERSRYSKIQSDGDDSILTLIMRDAGNAYDFSKRNFEQHVRCELDKIEISNFYLQTDYIRRLLNTVHSRHMKLGFVLSQRVQEYLTGENVIIPPIFIMSKTFHQQQPVQQIQCKQSLGIQTNIKQLSQTIYNIKDHVSQMLNNVNIFTEETLDDCCIEKQPKFCRPNSVPGPVVLEQYSISMQRLSKRPILPLHPLKSRQIANKAENIDDGADLSHTVLSRSDDTRQSMILSQQYSSNAPTFRSINKAITNSVHGVMCSILPPSLMNASIDTYDSIIFGIMAQNGADIPASTAALIFAAVANKLNEDNQIEQPSISSSTVARAIAKQGIFRIE